MLCKGVAASGASTRHGHREVRSTLFRLGGLYLLQCRFAEAERFLSRAVVAQKGLAMPGAIPDHKLLALYVAQLGVAYQGQGRFSEAEQALTLAVNLVQGVSGREHHDLLTHLLSLGKLYMAQGRYADAEPILKRARLIAQTSQSRVAQLSFPIITGQLGTLYADEGRYADAEPLLKWVVAHDDEVSQAEHLRADSLRPLGRLYVQQHRFAEAEPLLKRVLAIHERLYGRESPQLLFTLRDLATVYGNQSDLTRQESVLKRALAIDEKALSEGHPIPCHDLCALAYFYMRASRFAEAMPLLNRAVPISDRVGESPTTRYTTYKLRAMALVMLGRRADAVADFRVALESAERQQSLASGAEQDQAYVFGENASAFEMMVALQAELGDYDEALSAMERAQARTLIEQIDRRGVDLLTALPPEQAAALRSREAEARSRVSEVEQQLKFLDQRRDLTLDDRRQQANSLVQRLAQARLDYVEAYRDIRNASPAYRLNAGKDRKPITLATLRKWAAQRSLVLEYVIGGDQSFVLVVPPGESKVRIEALEVKADQSAKLGIDPGPLTSARLQSILSNANQTGVLQRISTPASDQSVVDQLNALLKILIPEQERKAVLAGGLKHLVVLPDGPLALLPFEALVFETGQDPVYLLDTGPPITYGPSATVLYNLSEQVGSTPTDREPVLAVGDPAYGDVGAGGSQYDIHLGCTDSALTLWRRGWPAEPTAAFRHGDAVGRPGFPRGWDQGRHLESSGGHRTRRALLVLRTSHSPSGLSWPH